MSFDLNLSSDQRQVVEAAEALLSDHFPVSRLRNADAQDPLQEIAAFGAYALALPEDIGGAGFTLVEEVLIHVLFGRHLVSTRTLAAALGARLAAEAGDNDLATEIGGGEVPVCAGLDADKKCILFDPEDATHAVTWGADRLRLVDLAGLTPHTVQAMGHGRPVAEIEQGAAKAVAEASGTTLVRLADLLVSAQLLGAAEAVSQLAVDYAKVREQFGKPIGTFQAIKHQCADMAVGNEMVSAQLDMAAIAERDEREDAAFQTAAVRRLASRVALANARQTIQIHGGIGFSAEADVHHFLKQIHVLGQLGGAADLLEMESPLAMKEES